MSLTPISDYWSRHYLNRGMCSLCGNSGKIDTTGVRTAAGVLVGRVNFCICPNGQALRNAGVPASDTGRQCRHPDCQCSDPDECVLGDD